MLIKKMYCKRGTQGENWYKENSGIEVFRYNPSRKANRKRAERMYQGNEEPQLLHCIIEPTTKCNLLCPHCNRCVLTRPIADMSFDLFKKAVDEVEDLGVYSISLYALGEPLLNPRIYDMIDYIKDTPYCDLSTNATLDLTPLAQSNLNEIIISIDGFKETFEKMRFPAKYEEVVRRVEDFLKIKDRPIVRIQCIDTEETRVRKSEFIEHWLGKGADVVYWKTLEGMTQSLGDKLISKSEIASRKKTRIPCKQLFYTLTINASGDIEYCCHSPHGLSKLGNIKDIILAKAWEALKPIREEHKKGNYTDICKNCVDFSIW